LRVDEDVHAAQLDEERRVPAPPTSTTRSSASDRAVYREI
jgi:hypothetical protein